MISVEKCSALIILVICTSASSRGNQSQYLSCDSDGSNETVTISDSAYFTTNLHSVNFPNPYQAPFVNCVRNFVGPAGRRLRFLFTTAYISDDLEFYDGIYSGSNNPPLIKRVKGAVLEDQPKFSVVSSSNELAVVFKGIQNPDTGFNAQIDFIAAGFTVDETVMCVFPPNTWNLTADGEKILTFGWFWETTADTGSTYVSCARNITTSVGYRIKLAINFIELGPADSLTFSSSDGKQTLKFTSANNTVNAVLEMDGPQIEVALSFTRRG
uniref:CUB domain-containing protein n=1 Tax=Plectus sambesii TaxID=2011161 RepID=A0A914XBK1_9BILA